MSASRFSVVLCLLVCVQIGADGVFEVDRFDREPAELVIHRDPFNRLPDENADIPPMPESSQEVSASRPGSSEIPGSGMDSDPVELMSRRISYEGYTRKEGRYFFLIQVGGEFFIGSPGGTIAGNIRIIDGNDQMIHLEIEGEKVEIKIRDLIQ